MSRLLASVLVVTSVGAARAVQAQGGPPLETDDPGTPGPGHIELNVSADAEREAGGTAYDAPRLDANVGVGARLQLKLEVPWRVVSTPGQPSRTGIGNAALGIKWRFAESGSVTVSTYPQLTIGRAGSANDQEIADSETELLLPIEIAWDAGPAALDVEVGYQGAGSEDEVVYGLALAHSVRPSLELLGECHGSGRPDLTGQGVRCGPGFRWRIQHAVSLMGAFSAGVAGSAEDRPERRAFGGVQLRW